MVSSTGIAGVEWLRWVQETVVRSILVLCVWALGACETLDCTDDGTARIHSCWSSIFGASRALKFLGEMLYGGVMEWRALAQLGAGSSEVNVAAARYMYKLIQQICTISFIARSHMVPSPPLISKWRGNHPGFLFYL